MSAIFPAPARASGARAGAALGSRDGAALAVLSVLALLLRLSDLSRSLFTDEAFSLALSQRSFLHMLSLFTYEANGTLYSLVLWPLTRVIGTGEVAVRSPALVAGVASVPAMWWAARLLAGRQAAWVAAALLALNPMAVFYAQEARAYEFALLSAILAFGALAAACALPTRRRVWVGYVAAMLALAYCDLLAVPVLLPAQALLVLRARRAVVRPWLRSLVAIGVGCVPLLVISLISRSRRDPLYWLPKTSKGLVKTAIEEFAAGQSPGASIGLLTLVLGMLLLGGAAWRLRVSGRDRTGPGATLLLAACWGLLPIVLLLAISMVKPVFWPRYAIPALPGLCLMVGLCVVELSLGRRALSLAAAGLLAAVVVAGGVADLRQRSALEEDWSPIASWLRIARAPGEPTILDTAIVLPSLGYYDPAFSAPGDDLVVQEWGDRPVPAGVVGFRDPTGYGSSLVGPPSAARFASMAAVRGSVWMIVSEVDTAMQPDPRTGEAAQWARRHCRVQARQSVGVWAMHATGCTPG